MTNIQKTGLKEHIEWLKKEYQECINNGYSQGAITALRLSIKHAESMLENETYGEGEQ
jgi:predicted esterase